MADGRTDKTLPKIHMKTEENVNNGNGGNSNQEQDSTSKRFNKTHSGALNKNNSKDHKRVNSIIYKPRVWDQQPQAEAGVSVRQKVLGMRNTFNQEKLEREGKTESVNIIREANNIMRERNRNHSISVSSKTKSIKEYILDNKEINLKNYLIGLLKSERTFINDKEIHITKSLRNSEHELDMNIHQFMEYSEKEKKIMKDNEQVLMEIINKNKIHQAKKKSLAMENKKIYEELERKVRNINSLRDYTIFVYEVIAGKKHSNISNEKSEIRESRNKEKELVKITEKLISEFGERITSDGDILDDPSRLMGKFQIIEDNIIKIMDKKHLLENDKDNIEHNNMLEIKDLENREKLVKEEYHKLINENEKLLKNLKHLDKQQHDVGYTNDIEDLIEGIYKAGNFGERRSNTRLMKNKEINIVKEVLDNLREIEKEILNNIAKLEYYKLEDNDTLNFYVQERKEKNKAEKQEKVREKQEKMNEERKKKTEERMNKIVVKGRQVQFKTIVQKPKEINDLDTDKKEEENANDMLELHTNEG